MLLCVGITNGHKGNSERKMREQTRSGKGDEEMLRVQSLIVFKKGFENLNWYASEKSKDMKYVHVHPPVLPWSAGLAKKEEGEPQPIRGICTAERT